MSRTSALGAVSYNEESAWAESNSAFATRLAVLGEVDCSGLEQAKVDAARTVQYQSDYTHPIRSVMGGSFRTRMWLPGHGAATTGAISLDDHETLLGYVFGNATSSGSGTTISGGGATTTSLPVAAASGLAPGAIVWVGVLGDEGANGQASVVSTHAASTVALLVALPAAPADTEAVASSVMVYMHETPADAEIQSTRWLLQTANQEYSCHGVYPRSVTIDGLSPGEIPAIEVEWGVSRFEPTAATFPSATAVDTHNPAPIAAGSLFIQNRGTTTRQTVECRSFKVTIDLGVEPKMGPGGVGEFQHIVGAARGRQSVTVEFEVDADDANGSYSTWAGRWDSDSQDYHLLYNFNGAASGRRMALYLPNACIVDRRPMQIGGGINRERIVMRAKTGLTTTSARTLSAARLAFG